MVTNLKELVGKKYRVTVQEGFENIKDAEEQIWGQEILGKYGSVYPYGLDGALALYLKSNSLRSRFSDTSKFKLLLKAEKETTYKFYKDDLNFVLVNIRGRKKKVLSPEHLARLRSTAFKPSKPL